MALNAGRFRHPPPPTPPPNAASEAVFVATHHFGSKASFLPFCPRIFPHSDAGGRPFQFSSFPAAVPLKPSWSPSGEWCSPPGQFGDQTKVG